jgi:protein-tyrosine phosphatase
VTAWRPNLNWITDHLAVGGSFPTGKTSALARKHRVSAVIDLRGEAVPDPIAMRRHGIALLHLPTPDMRGMEMPDLEYGVRFASDFIDAEERVLIHCAHGVGRSAMLALCLLVHRGMKPLDALALLKQQRPQTALSPSQFECWLTWLDAYRFVRDAGWALPSFDEFSALAHTPRHKH